MCNIAAGKIVLDQEINFRKGKMGNTMAKKLLYSLLYFAAVITTFLGVMFIAA